MVNFCFRNTIMFMTPGLPFVPAIAITVNIYLIFKLSILTLVRFTIWMTLGFIMYFYYGIKNSTLEEAADSDQNIELTVTDSEKPKYNNVTSDQSIFRYILLQLGRFFIIFIIVVSCSQNQPTYDWNPKTNWDHQPSWAQPQQQQPQWAQPTTQQYQVEQQYNLATNNTRSVINKSNTATATSSNANNSGTPLFVSETQFPSWDD